MVCSDHCCNSSPHPISRRLGEIIDAIDPNREIGFGFVFVSCVRASGRGEAVWACEGAMFPNAGAQNGKMCSGGGGSGSAVSFSFLLLCSWAFWLLEFFWCYNYSWVFWFVWVFAAMRMGFLMCLCIFLVFLAMLMVFLIFLCFCCYAHGFFDVFAHLLRFRCYAHGFFYFVVFLLVCSWVFWCVCTHFSF